MLYLFSAALFLPQAGIQACSGMGFIMNKNSSSKNTGEVLLQIRDLSIGIHEAGGVYTAVDSISYDVYAGEILGVVGESGCGKTVTNLAIMGLLPDVLFVKGGSILYKNRDLNAIKPAERAQLNGDEMAMIYQEPLTSLNPLMKIGKQVGEPLRIHHKLPKEKIRERVIEVLGDVDLPDPEEIMERYPHQLSGGQRQRVMIAMAAITRPRLLIADEPTTALDVTVQAQILQLLKRLNRKYRTSIIFISHDLAVINQICDRVIVMYAGKIAEVGTTRMIMDSPAHEYTKGLIRSIPTMDQKGSDLHCIPGHVPSTTDDKLPCPFADRCTIGEAVCRKEAPPCLEIEPGHIVYCHCVSGQRQ